ncbi:unnamed protein product [Lampetra planeri]
MEIAGHRPAEARGRGRIGYGKELFLTDLGQIDCRGLPLYYRSITEAWRSLEWNRTNPYCSMSAFIKEPLFFNNLFMELRQEKTMALRFATAGVRTVGDLVEDRGGRLQWKSAAEISRTAGLRTILAGEKILRTTLAAAKTLKLQLNTPRDADIARPSPPAFSELRIACVQPPGRRDAGMLLKLENCGNDTLKSASKETIYSC